MPMLSALLETGSQTAESAGSLAETKIRSILIGVIAVIAAVVLLVMFFIDPMMVTILLVALLLGITIILTQRC